VYICVFDFALISIIENLLINSIRKVLEAKKPEMWIKLVTAEEIVKNETYTILKWMDSGTGIADSRKMSIFEGDSDKTEEGDHGIGLRDIKNTMESVNGFIRESGVFGEGAVFLLGFPKVEKVEEIDFDKDFEDEEKLVFPSEYSDKKIVIIDDKAEIGHMIEGFLSRAGIRKVTVFTDGKEALNHILQAKEAPDLILTDLEMEPVDGAHLIELIRARKKEIPVLVISGILFSEDKTDYARLIELNKLGVVDVITKPVDNHELFEKLKRIFKACKLAKGKTEG
jgi:CheY-like chemotaxis protein